MDVNMIVEDIDHRLWCTKRKGLKPTMIVVSGLMGMILKTESNSIEAYIIASNGRVTTYRGVPIVVSWELPEYYIGVCTDVT